ncbi:Protein MULTIPOLAR SPINDLE 1 [Heracleum sosnowskyi]|uniref:Protein MULTIPOLAR SPINDLE 1 n=1 Tax=Heracleum sosnowskyi TaxID=360622 RepID=A0AAD8J182_9APIA|nr:Protein MULTIPOLAR SPINDLE 1 [Heracleum sosnowskyi]
MCEVPPKQRDSSEKMASSTQGGTGSNNMSESLKIAIAMALCRSNLLPKQTAPPPPLPSTSSSPHSDALKWKRKAKERKQMILRLKEDLKQAEDGLHYDLFPQSASCKCYFLGNLDNLSSRNSTDNSEWRFNDVLRRRFLRQVRINERRKTKTTGDSAQKQCLPDCSNENELEQLSAAVNFLVELCDNVSSIQVGDTRYLSWLHQAVDFILDAVKNLLSIGKTLEPLEGIVNSLIMHLVRRMCAATQEDERLDADAQFRIQQLICKLGNEPYIGQRVIFSVWQRISVLAESLLFMDPFNDAFPSMHRCMYIMIELIEYLVSGYLVTWSRADDFDTGLLEAWVTSLLQAQKTVNLLESRNGLYILYMDRVIGEVTKIVGQVSSLQKLNEQCS